jgi:hypothetical protein
MYWTAPPGSFKLHHGSILTSRLLPRRTEMKRRMNTGICLGAAAFFALAVAGFAAPDELVTFTGSLAGQETDTLVGMPPSAIGVSGGVSGAASRIGEFTLSYQVSVSLPAGTSTGTAQLKAANGDMISSTIIGRGVSVPGTNLNSVMEINVITGGTGRFAGASGYFITNRLVGIGQTPVSVVQTFGSIVGSVTLAGH